MKIFGQNTGKGRNTSDYDPAEERRQMRKAPATPKRKPCGKKLRGKCPVCGLEGLK